MKNSFASTFLAIALGLQQATANSASGAWPQHDKYITPATCENVCTLKQGSGYNFADLDLGVVVKYDAFSFSGFSCENTNGGSKIGRRTTRVSL